MVTIQEEYVEVELSELMNVLKNQKDLFTALTRAMEINMGLGYELIGKYEQTILKQHYRAIMSRDIRKEMIKGYMKMGLK